MRDHARHEEDDRPHKPVADTDTPEIESIEEAEERKNEHHETRYS